MNCSQSSPLFSDINVLTFAGQMHSGIYAIDRPDWHDDRKLSCHTLSFGWNEIISGWYRDRRCIRNKTPKNMVFSFMDTICVISHSDDFLCFCCLLLVSCRKTRERAVITISSHALIKVRFSGKTDAMVLSSCCFQPISNGVSFWFLTYVQVR